MKINFPSLLLISSTALAAMLIFAGAPLFTPTVTLLGIAFVALVSLVSYGFASKSINDPNPNKFVRVVMSMTMIKFFVCLIGAGAMIFTLKKELNKPDLYLLMGVYLVYSIMESIFLSQLARQRKTD